LWGKEKRFERVRREKDWAAQNGKKKTVGGNISKEKGKKKRKSLYIPSRGRFLKREWGEFHLL